MSRACVIGAGLGGLALAIRLQAAGIATTLVEAADQAGGCARTIDADGQTFDAGPQTITDAAGLAALWQAADAQLADDVTLVPLAPVARVLWPDGASFDWWSDPAQRRAEIARIAPGDVAGYEDLLRDGEETRLALAPPAGEGEDARAPAGRSGLLRGPAARVARRLPALIRHQAWRSRAGRLEAFIASRRLREVLALPSVAFGANPFAVGLSGDGGAGAFRVEGGMRRLVAAMVALFVARGGTLRLGSPVARLATLGTRVHEVVCTDGWAERFDAVASGADLLATYGTMLAGTPHGAAVAARLARRAWSPAVFSVHLALGGRWPGIAAQTVLLPGRFRGLIEDIFDHGVLPRDMAILLNHTPAADPAPGAAAVTLLSAHVPVANRAQLPIDWAEIGPRLAQRVQAEITGRLIPDLAERMRACLVQTPADHAAATGAHAGAAFALAPTRLSALGLPGPWARAPLRDPVMRNLYLVGAGTAGGAGIAAAVAGAAAAAAMIAADLRG